MDWFSPELLTGPSILALVVMAVVKLVSDDAPRRAAVSDMRESLKDAKDEIRELRVQIDELEEKLNRLSDELHSTTLRSNRWETRARSLGWLGEEGD